MLPEQKDIKLYADLYDHVKHRLEENGQTLNCNKTGFIYSIETLPKVIFYQDFEKLDSDAFLSCIFLKCFQRLPSEKEREKCASMDRGRVVSYVVNKASYSIRGIDFRYCPYSTIPGLRGRLFGLAAKIVSSPKMRKIAKKMPAGIQNKIRGTFR